MNICICVFSFEIYVNVFFKSFFQLSVYVYKKLLQFGKDLVKENLKLKVRKKKIKDMRLIKVSSVDNILNSNDNGIEFVKERVELILIMDELKLREVVKICNKIYEIWIFFK